MKELIILYTQSINIKDKTSYKLTKYYDLIAASHSLVAQMDLRQCVIEDVPFDKISTQNLGNDVTINYPTVLHALADGWILLGPPQRPDHRFSEVTWWLYRK